MKLKTLCGVIALTFCTVATAQTYEKTLGVARYRKLMKYCPSIMYRIPLYTSRQTSMQIIIRQYEATKYYDQYIKATEYPIATWQADYSGGLLRTAKDVDKKEIYYFDYDGSGILSSYRKYNQETGSLIQRCNITDRLEYWETGLYTDSNYDIVWVNSWGITSYFKIDNGLWLNYLAIKTEGRSGIYVRGSLYEKPGWVASKCGLAWRSTLKGHDAYCHGCLAHIYEAAIREGDMMRWQDQTVVSPAGLVVGGGIPNCEAEDLRKIVSGEYIYEYSWTATY